MDEEGPEPGPDVPAESSQPTTAPPPADDALPIDEDTDAQVEPAGAEDDTPGDDGPGRPDH